MNLIEADHSNYDTSHMLTCLSAAEGFTPSFVVSVLREQCQISGSER